jgi:small subunit ribosomal protein S9
MTETKQRYIEAVGRRKTAVARVRITPSAKGSLLINDKELATYFVTTELQNIVKSALTVGSAGETYVITVHVNGGGIHAQAEAVRHGLSRTLVERDATVREALKKLGYLKRDSRQVERKKFGLKKARKAPTWSKR